MALENYFLIKIFITKTFNGWKGLLGRFSHLRTFYTLTYESMCVCILLLIIFCHGGYQPYVSFLILSNK